MNQLLSDSKVKALPSGAGVTRRTEVANENCSDVTAEGRSSFYYSESSSVVNANNLCCFSWPKPRTSFNSGRQEFSWYGPPGVQEHRPSAHTFVMKFICVNLQQEKTWPKTRSHRKAKHHIFYLSFLQIFLASVKIHWQFSVRKERQALGCVPLHLR